MTKGNYKFFNIFIDEVNFWSMLEVYNVVKLHRLSSKQYIVNYIYLSGINRYFISLFKVLFRIEIKKAAFEFDSIRDKNDSNLYLQIFYDILRQFYMEITDSDWFMSKVKSWNLDNKFNSFIGRVLFERNYISIDKLVWLINILKQNSDIISSRNVNSYLLLSQNPLIFFLQPYAKKKDVEIIEYRKRGISLITLQMLTVIQQNIYTKFIERYAKYLLTYAYSLLHPRYPKMKSYRIGNEKTNLKVFLHTILNKYPVKSFWRELKLDSTLFFLPGSYPLNNEQRNELISGCCEYISDNRNKSFPSNTLLIVPRYGNVNSNKQPINDWIDKEVAKHQDKINLWREYFLTTNSRVYVSQFKYTIEHFAITEAMRSIGGISTLFQEAIMQYPSPSLGVSTDVFFTFSNHQSKIDIECNSDVNYRVVIGCISDYRIERYRENSINLKKNLRGNGADFIVSYFDENSSDDSRFGHSHKYWAHDYIFLLNKLLEDDSFGLVLKPKKPETLKKRLGESYQLLRTALNTGRCICFSEPFETSPIEAAQISDLAIHSSSYAVTAGFEAYLSGTPSVMLDRENIKVDEFSNPGYNLVFPDIENLWNRITEFKEKRTHNLGEWDKVADIYDPYRDGKSKDRLIAYLNKLSTGLMKGQDREEVLEETSIWFGSIWGKDKIIINQKR